MTWIEGTRAALLDEGPEIGSLEARASRAFKVMAIVGYAGIILSLLPDAFPNSTLLTVAFNWSAALVSTLYLIGARGLDRGRPWAIAAARPMLVILGAWGAFASIFGLTQGIVRIPFELALAVWAFLGGPGFPGMRSRPRLGGRGMALIMSAVPLLATMGLGYLVFGWGGVLDVKEQDLVASLDLDCGDPGAGPPGEIRVVYAWSWSRTTPLPNEVDTVVVGWSGDDAEGRPLYVVGDIPATEPGIQSGQRGQLATALAEEARSESNGAFQWAVDLNRRDYRPGRIELALMLARDDATGPLSLTVKASYIHLGLWRSAAPDITCTW